LEAKIKKKITFAKAEPGGTCQLRKEKEKRQGMEKKCQTKGSQGKKGEGGKRSSLGKTYVER